MSFIIIFSWSSPLFTKKLTPLLYMTSAFLLAWLLQKFLRIMKIRTYMMATKILKARVVPMLRT